MTEKLRIFVSSVIREDELKEERKAACQKIDNLAEPICFEFTEAESTPPPEWSLQNIQNCDVFVQLLDKTVTPPVIGEYEIAKNENKPIIVLLKKNPTRDQELDNYIGRIQYDIKYGEFFDLDELEILLEKAVNKAIVHFARGRHAGKTADACIESAEAFRVERLDTIYDRTKPTLLNGDYPKVIFHIVPCGAFEKRRAKIKLELLEDDERLRPLGAMAWRAPICEGNSIKMYTRWPNSNTTDAYVEIFETGIVEAVKLLSYDPQDKRIDRTYEREVASQLPQYVSLLQQHGIRPPLYMTLSFEEVRDWRMWVTRDEAGIDVFHPKPPIAKNRILAEGELLYNLDDVKNPENVDRFMRPMYDTLWREAHWLKSFR